MCTCGSVGGPVGVYLWECRRTSGSVLVGV